MADNYQCTSFQKITKDYQKHLVFMCVKLFYATPNQLLSFGLTIFLTID